MNWTCNHDTAKLSHWAVLTNLACLIRHPNQLNLHSHELRSLNTAHRAFVVQFTRQSQALKAFFSTCRTVWRTLLRKQAKHLMPPCSVISANHQHQEESKCSISWQHIMRNPLCTQHALTLQSKLPSVQLLIGGHCRVFTQPDEMRLLGEKRRTGGNREKRKRGRKVG